MENKKKKILVLEDERALARALELKLVHEGFDVKTDSNGKNVLQFLSKEGFSLVVCDMLMPEFDGFKVLEVIKDNKIKVPVIILTNLSQPEDEKRVRELGAVDFLIKANTPIADVIERIKKRVG